MPSRSWPELRAAVQARDGAALAAWFGLSAEQGQLLSTLELDDPEPPRPGGVRVATALRSDGSGFLVVDNPSWVSRHVATSIGPNPVCHELYPRREISWLDRITVAARQLHLLEIGPLDALTRPALTGARGTADESGQVANASATPGTIARTTILPVSGEPVEAILVFDEDGLLTSIGGWRDELDMLADPGSAHGDFALTTTWTPGKACYDSLDELHVVVDVPAAASVRWWVDGEQIPVQRTYVSAHPEPELPAELADDQDVQSHVVDLSAAKRARPDPEQPWQLRLEIQGLPGVGFAGVHLSGVPHRSTEMFTRIELRDSPWLQAAADAPSGGALTGQYTIGQLLVANRFQPDPPGAVYESDVVYGDGGGTPLLASVYRRRNTAEHAPAVIFVHGGGWAAGDRGFHYRHMHLLASHGYVTINVEYRLYPQVHWRDAVADVKCAVRWARQHAAQLGIDPARIAVAGGSAGGHLAAMVACTPGRWEGEGGWAGVSSEVSAAVLWYPALDLPAVCDRSGEIIAEVMTEYFGTEMTEASPISHVSPDCPPVLTFCGDEDRLVSIAPLQRFHGLLAAADVRNKLIIYPGRDHAFDIFASDWADSAAAMRAFLDHVLDHSE